MKQRSGTQFARFSVINELTGSLWPVRANERGKTFSVQDYVLNCYFNPKSKLYKVPFY